MLLGEVLLFQPVNFIHFRPAMGEVFVRVVHVSTALLAVWSRGVSFKHMTCKGSRLLALVGQTLGDRTVRVAGLIPCNFSIR